MRILYTVMLALMLPLILARLLWRSVRQRGYRLNITERFGSYHQPSLNDCIWVHAVSVGEARAAEPLIAKLKVQYPERAILLTGMTPAGRATAEQLFGHTVSSVYLPYDFVSLHQRLLDHFQPSILLIMETEIWPNLLHACHRNAVPTLIVNARLSEKSLRRYTQYAAIAALIQQALRSVSFVAAQSSADAERFRALGAAQIVVTGNIKFDVLLDAALIAAGHTWRLGLGSRHVLLCASTREGEEALLLEAYQLAFDADARRNTLLVIVPRHPQRFDRVAGEIENAGLRLIRRSQTVAGAIDLSSAEVLLGDSMGEMAAYLSLCDVAIIGGSFLPLGGQNLIEACTLGKPVIMGPSTFNFAEAARLAQDVGAMVQVDNAPEAMRVAHALLQDEGLITRMSDAGRKLVAANQGSTEKVAALVATAIQNSRAA